MEIMGAHNFWMLPNGSITEDIGDHIPWFTDNVETEFYHDEDGFPIKQDGSIAEEEDVYDAAFALGYIKLTKEIVNGPLYFDYSPSKPLTNLQLRNLKNFAIENRWELKDAVTQRDIDLL